MLEFYNHVEEWFDGDESSKDQINYQLLLAAQDCLNIIVHQFHKLDPVAQESENEYDSESFEERLKFLEYGSCMEVFIYRTQKYYSLLTALAKRIDSSKLSKIISDHKSIVLNKVQAYIRDNEILAERIVNGQPYVSPVDFIVEGKVNTKVEPICVYPQEIAPLDYSWNVAIREYKKYIASSVAQG